MVIPSGSARPARTRGARPQRDRAYPGPQPGMQDAACVSADPELFFPQDRLDPQIRDAKRICARCPAAARCREYSLSTGQEFGIWGGIDEWDRRDLLAAMRRQGQQGADIHGVA